MAEDTPDCLAASVTGDPADGERLLLDNGCEQSSEIHPDPESCEACETATLAPGDTVKLYPGVEQGDGATNLYLWEATDSGDSGFIELFPSHRFYDCPEGVLGCQAAPANPRGLLVVLGLGLGLAVRRCDQRSSTQARRGEA